MGYVIAFIGIAIVLVLALSLSFFLVGWGLCSIVLLILGIPDPLVLGQVSLSTVCGLVTLLLGGIGGGAAKS